MDPYPKTCAGFGRVFKVCRILRKGDVARSARRDDEGTPAGGRRDGASSGAGCEEKRDGWRVPARLVVGIRLGVDHRPARRSCWRRMPFDDPRRPNTWTLLGNSFVLLFSYSVAGIGFWTAFLDSRFRKEQLTCLVLFFGF